MTKRVRTIVKSSQGKNANRRGLQEVSEDEAVSKPALTSGMLGRVAIVIFVCVYIAAHAWGIYKIETALHMQLPSKDTATVFGE